MLSVQRAQSEGSSTMRSVRDRTPLLPGRLLGSSETQGLRPRADSLASTHPGSLIPSLGVNHWQRISMACFTASSSAHGEPDLDQHAVAQRGKLGSWAWRDWTSLSWSGARERPKGKEKLVRRTSMSCMGDGGGRVAGLRHGSCFEGIAFICCVPSDDGCGNVVH